MSDHQVCVDKHPVSTSFTIERKCNSKYSPDYKTASHRGRFSHPEVYANKDPPRRNSMPITTVEQRQELVRASYSSAGSLYRSRGPPESEEYSIQMSPASMTVAYVKQRPCSTSSLTRSNAPCKVVREYSSMEDVYLQQKPMQLAQQIVPLKFQSSNVSLKQSPHCEASSTLLNNNLSSQPQGSYGCTREKKAKIMLYTLLVALVVTIVGATWLAIGSLLSQTQKLEFKLARLELDLLNSNSITNPEGNSSALFDTLPVRRLQIQTLLLQKQLDVLNVSSYIGMSDILERIHEISSNLYFINVTVRELKENVLNVSTDGFNAVPLGNNSMLKCNEELKLDTSATVTRLEKNLTEIRSTDQANQHALNYTIHNIIQRLLDLETQAFNYTNETTNSINNLNDMFANIVQIISQVQNNQIKFNIFLNSSVQQNIAKLEVIVIEIARVSHMPLGNACSDILSNFPNALSGYYYIRSSKEEARRVFCDMTLSCSGITGGWTRVGYLNASSADYQCPPGFSFSNISGTLSCEATQQAPSCSSIFYNLTNTDYTDMCGKVNAYSVGLHHGFHPVYRPPNRDIDENYLDGVSITYGSPRQHLWSLAVGQCPCSNGKPVFVESHYSCDEHPNTCPSRGFCPYPLWNGNNTCASHTQSWFHRRLEQFISDDIEVRVCKGQAKNKEDIIIGQIEIFVQ